MRFLLLCIIFALLPTALPAQLVIYDSSAQALKYPELTAEIAGYVRAGYYEMRLDRYRIRVHFDPGVDTLMTSPDGRPIDIRAVTSPAPMYRRGTIRFDLRDIRELPPPERCEIALHELFHLQDAWVGHLLRKLTYINPELTAFASDMREQLATDVARMRIWRHICPGDHL